LGVSKPRLDRETMAMRVARELKDGDVVNLGIGIPTLVANYIPPDKAVILHSENGVLKYGPLVTEPQNIDIDLINAGGQFVTPLAGTSYFDSADAFVMIRGGHIDVAVLGGLQISEKGDLANWMLPERGIGNVGGGMDLVAGAKRLIVTMEHTDRQGNPKILKGCTYPLTGKGCVDLIVSDIAVIDVTEAGLVLREVAPGWKPSEVQSLTDPKLIVPADLREIAL